MEMVPIQRKENNMEIICKLLNSVAKQCGCRVNYNSQSGALQFSGDPACRKYIIEETLAFFRAA